MYRCSCAGHLFYIQIPRQFIQDVERIFVESRRVLLNNREGEGLSEEITENLVGRLECALVIIEEGIQLMRGSQYCGELQLLNNMRQTAGRYTRQIVYGFNDCTIPPVRIQQFRVYLHSGTVGRPQLVVNIEQVELLRACGYTWNEVSQCLNVSRLSLWRRMRDMNVSLSKYSDISDSQLDELVSSIQ